MVTQKELTRASEHQEQDVFSPISGDFFVCCKSQKHYYKF